MKKIALHEPFIDSFDIKSVLKSIKTGFKKNIIDTNKKIYQVMEIFEKTNIPIALIKNKEQKFIGTLTDGDLRRILLKKKKS